MPSLSLVSDLSFILDMSKVDLNTVDDVHAATGLLKLYFRELAEPLFTDDLYDDFVLNACTFNVLLHWNVIVSSSHCGVKSSVFKTMSLKAPLLQFYDFYHGGDQLHDDCSWCAVLCR